MLEILQPVRNPLEIWGKRLKIHKKYGLPEVLESPYLWDLRMEGLEPPRLLGTGF
jgi:hypothetical protein